MITLVKDITADPDINKPGQIEAQLDLFVTQSKARIPQQNQQAQEVEALALNAEVAAGELANAKWVSGTTYSEGDVRWSPTDFLNYRRKTNGAGTTDPSADAANWALLTKTGAGGSDTTNSAVDITLTSISGRLQVIDMTAINKKVTLPSAITLQKGTPTYVFKNNGAYKYHIHDGDGVYLASVTPGQVAAFHCSDTTTSAGIWSANGNDLEYVKTGTVSVLNAVATSHISIAMISATAAVIAYKNVTSGKAEGLVVNIGAAEGSVTVLTADTVSSNELSITVLSAAQMMLLYKDAVSSYPKVIVIDYSGNTLTPGPAVVIAPVSAANGLSIARTNDTSAIASYSNGSPISGYSASITVSGSTPTVGTPVITLPATISAGPIASAAISATKGIIVSGTTSGQSVKMFTISGLVVTATGTALSIATVSPSAGQIGIVVLDSNLALITQSGSTNTYDFRIRLLDISGTSPVLLDSWTSPAGYNTYNCWLSKIDARVALLLSASTGIAGGNAAKVRVSQNKLYVEPMTKMYTVVNPSVGIQTMEALSAKNAVLAYRGLDTFLNIQEVEVSPL